MREGGPYWVSAVRDQDPVRRADSQASQGRSIGSPDDISPSLRCQGMRGPVLEVVLGLS